MKTQFQTLTFLSNYTPKTALDKEFIDSFLAQRFKIPSNSPRNAPNSALKPLDVPSFMSWFESGLESLKMARFQNLVVLTGNVTLETVEIIASRTPEGIISTQPFQVAPDELEGITQEEADIFLQALIDAKIQPDPTTLRMRPRYIPEQGHRVIFYDYGLETRGVGVVRDVDDAGNVIFFCYFTYPSPTTPRRLGYSMQEDPGFNLRSMLFENIDEDNKPVTLGNSTSCFRRLGRELERVGKVWKDKLLRIEPLEVKVAKGERYYYISDKLKVVTDFEKGTPTSHARYLSGNYFRSHLAAVKMLGRLQDELRDYLASPGWPEVE